MENQTIQIQVEEFVYEKVKKTDSIINIPQVPMFFQEYNGDVVYGLFPKFATWANNELYEIVIIRIADLTDLTITVLRTSPTSLSDEIAEFSLANRSRDALIRETVIRYLKDYYGSSQITKDRFMEIYNTLHTAVINLFNNN